MALYDVPDFGHKLARVELHARVLRSLPFRPISKALIGTKNSETVKT